MDDTAAGELVSYADANGVATICLNRPERLNALNANMRLCLIEAVKRAESNPQVRAVLFEGAGRSFCAGQDQRESASMTADQADLRITQYTELFSALRTISKPTVVQLQGYAVGAGLQLALHCDLRFADEHAQFGMTELNVGSACITGTDALAGVLGMSRSREFIVLGDFIDAHRAREIGLVTEVHGERELSARVGEVVARLRGRDPMPFALTKKFWRDRTQSEFEMTVQRAHLAHAQNYETGGLRDGAVKFVEGNRGRQ